MKFRSQLAVLPFILLMAACGGGSDDAEGDTPEAEETGVRIVGSENGRLTEGKASDQPLPTPTSNGNEPEILDFYIQQVGDGEYEFVVEVNSGVPLSAVHLEIDGEHYIIDLSGTAPDPVSIDVCDTTASITGVTCTEGCLEACGCLSGCSGVIADSIAGSCAAQCSALAAEGLIGPEPYTSEAVYADIIYNGTTIDGTYIAGVLESFGECDGSSCSNLAASTKTVYFGITGVDYSFLSGLNVSAQVATPPTPNSPASISQPTTSMATLGIRCAAIACGY